MIRYYGEFRYADEVTLLREKIGAPNLGYNL